MASDGQVASCGQRQKLVLGLGGTLSLSNEKDKAIITREEAIHHKILVGSAFLADTIGKIYRLMGAITNIKASQ